MLKLLEEVESSSDVQNDTAGLFVLRPAQVLGHLEHL